MKTFIRRLAVAAVVVSTVTVVPAGATTTGPTWSNARAVSLPAGAAGLAQGYLPALSCPTATNCTAAGAFNDASNNTEGLIITETNGVWGVPQTLSPPANAGSNPFTTIFSLACPKVNRCAAGGSYQDQGGNVQAFVVSQTSSTWPVAQPVNLPSNAGTASQNAQVRYVACASVGNCSAVGTYQDANTNYPRTVAFAVNQVNGTWGSALPLTLPTNANFNPLVSVNQLACRSVGNCSTVGSYVDSDNVTRAFVANEVAGVWQRGVAITLPGDANAYALSSLSEITCASASNCLAIGTYANATGALEGFSVEGVNGSWGRGVTMSMPAGAATNPHVFFYGFSGVNCASVGNCSVGGQYQDASHHYQGFLINEVSGVWRRASAAVLPNGAVQAGKNGGVVAVSCPSAGNCSAGAAYLDGAGQYQAVVLNEVNGTWLPGKKVGLPAGAVSVGVAGGIYGLICPSTGTCTATGSFLDNNGVYQGFTLSGA